MLGYRLVQQRAFGVAWVVELGLGSAGGLIGLTGYSLVQQLMALKIQNDFKQQATDAGLAPDAA